MVVLVGKTTEACKRARAGMDDDTLLLASRLLLVLLTSCGWVIAPVQRLRAGA